MTKQYRLKVIAGFDTRSGVKKGEAFFPFIHAIEDKERLIAAAVTWDSMGHTSVIETRTIETNYGEWEEDNG